MEVQRSTCCRQPTGSLGTRVTEYVTGSITIVRGEIAAGRLRTSGFRSLVVFFIRDPPRPFASQLNYLHTTAASKMHSIVRHVTRSSSSLRTAVRRPTTLNMRPTGMGTNRIAIRTLISKSLLFRGPSQRENRALSVGLYGASLIISFNHSKEVH